MRQFIIAGVFCFSLLFASPFFQSVVDAQGHAGHCGCPNCSGKGNGGANNYNLNGRWSSTATDGGGLGLGQATTITWRIVDDGNAISGEGSGSDLVNMMDTIFSVSSSSTDYTQRVWFNLFEDSFDRWSELGGVSYVYEANDDGSQISPSANFGQLGTRADVRIGGVDQGGPGGVLAYNWFPNGGDMVFDTADIANYGNAMNNYRFLRNVTMHEHGHGLGFGHIESASDSFLMEPFINTSFDGPQIDEIRGLHRAYGDVNEKAGGNDSLGNATNIGTLSGTDEILIGEDARPDAGNTVRTVDGTDVDFVSIDDASDSDFYEINLTQDALVDVLLTPGGGSYQQTPQGGGGGGTPFDTTAVSDLDLAVFDASGNLISSANATGAGSAEMINGLNLLAGNYFIRVQGNAGNVQLYELQINSFSTVPEPGSLGVLALMGLGLFSRRRRQR